MIVEPVTRQDTKHFGKPSHHYLDATGARIPGVTTILGDGLPKPALIAWAANVTAEAAVNRWPELSELSVSDRLKLLKGVRYADRDEAARRGTEVHALGEQLVRGEQVIVPDALAGHVDAYLQFLDEWQPDPVLVEATVYSRPYGYAGTLDLVADMRDGRRLLLDLKTTRSGVYGETALQLAAYRYADRYLSPDGPADMVEVDDTAVVWVRSDGYDLVPVTAGPEQLKLFRHVALVARSVGGLKDLVGAALHAPEGVAS